MHTLPALPYAYDALEPFIDAQTMQIHHTKHHQTYVDKLNAAIQQFPDLQAKSVEELLMNLNQLPDQVKKAVQNHGGGHSNHSLFWTIIGPNAGSKPSGKLAQEISTKFASFEGFCQQFSEVAANHFGSGWVWLAWSKEEGLHISALANQDSPYLHQHIPIFGLDVWEHAYYLKYQNRRAEYITAFWNIVNWVQVDTIYQRATS